MKEPVAGVQLTHFADQFTLGLLFIITITLLIVFVEIGFRLGKQQQGKIIKAQASQVRAIMGTTLGLLAFMLAFTFATAQNHFETRVANLAEEARLAHNAFLHAEQLNTPAREQARYMLREYVDIRLLLEETEQWDEVVTLVEKSESMQRELWKLAIANKPVPFEPDQGGLRSSHFMASVVGLIDIHNLRLQAELANRISWVVWVTLYLTAALGMLVMGYLSGLIRKRSPIATVSLVLAFTAVMMLTTDLDRPMTGLFEMSTQSLVILADNMDKMLLNE